MDNRFSIFIHIIGHAGSCSLCLYNRVIIRSGFGVGNLTKSDSLTCLSLYNLHIGHWGITNRSQPELEFFIRVVAACTGVAGDCLGHLRLRRRSGVDQFGQDNQRRAIFCLKRFLRLGNSLSPAL